MSKFRIISVVVLLLAVLWIIVLRLDFSSVEPPVFGVHFSKAYSEFLGLDWQATYRALLDDLQIDHVRLAAYWNEIEPKSGQDNFSALDWQMREADKRQVKVILVVGARVPRWPECYVPDWVKTLAPADQTVAQKRFIEQVVDRYKNFANLEFWQVENEPFLTVFGNCARMSESLVRDEIALVRARDPRHPIITTDSGELSWWRQAARLGDIFGTTMYRTVWHPWLGYISYDGLFPPALYRWRAWLVGKKLDQVFITELQAEPWVPNGSVIETTLAEQNKTMNPVRFQQNIRSAKRTGFARVYLWGGEWWYWLKVNGNDEMWKTVGLLWQKNKR